MERILVTGITGFIGTHLAQRLVKEGYEVYGITKPSVTKDMSKFREFLEGVIVLSCDVSDYYSVYNELKGVDADTVVHLAALSPVRDSFEKPFSYERNNIEGTMDVVHAVLNLPDFKRRKLIYASTAEVYGEQESKLVKESEPLNPTSPYAVTKAATDMYLRMMSRVYGLNTTVMRCTNSYGRKLDTSFFVEYVVVNMLKGNKVYIGAPNSIRDYMYIDDHVDAYVKAIQIDHASGEAFNFGAGAGLVNKDVAFKIADMIGYDKKSIVLGKYPPGYPLRPIESDQPSINLDSAKAKKVFGWYPKTSLEDGLKKTIAYWKGKLKS
jgi:nucleoside-diphosphate-sugar epimerase